MLKGKGSLYILFPLVVIIWGIIIYKIVKVFEDKPVTFRVTQMSEEERVTEISKDTFSLLPQEQDPFLGHTYKKPENSKPSKAANSATGKVEWPEIVYLGLVSDTGKASTIHVVQINGKQFLLEKGNTADGVKLLLTGSNNVTFLFRGSRKTFSKI